MLNACQRTQGVGEGLVRERYDRDVMVYASRQRRGMADVSRAMHRLRSGAGMMLACGALARGLQCLHVGR